MTYNFTYHKKDYRYEVGKWIEQCDQYGVYVSYCPVFVETDHILAQCSEPQVVSILQGIVHGYQYGVSQGKAQKVKEFHRVLELDSYS